MIPVSTAMYDPKWYHNFRDPAYQFFDKRGILNGVRITPFVPDESCHNLCQGKNCKNNPVNCAFIKQYKKQLNKLDYDNIMNNFEILADQYINITHIQTIPKIILLVYEAPNNLCSERQAIQEWFINHNVKISEWNNKI